MTLTEMFGSAVRHHLDGRFAEAEQLYREILQRDPGHADSLHLLGILAGQSGRKDVALHLISQAIAIKDNDAAYHSNLANLLTDLGRCDEAVTACKAALAIDPLLAEAHCNLANAWRDVGRPADAAKAAKSALCLRPSFVEALCNLGNARNDLGELGEALAAFTAALRVKADYAEAHYNLGNGLRDLGRLTDAVAAFRIALILKPDYSAAWCNLGVVQKDLGHLDDGIAALTIALRLNWLLAEAHTNRGNALRDQGRSIKAGAAFRAALQIRPDFAEAHSNLGNAFNDIGEIDAAIRAYQAALRLKPDYAEAYSNLLYLWAGQSDRENYLDLARGWEQACLPPAVRSAAKAQRVPRTRKSGDRLRVGYVSGDFRQHAVSYFIEQILTHHDHRRVEIFAFPTTAQRDAVSQRLQRLSDHWLPLIGRSDQQAARMIAERGIDVLIDLSGHTAGNRLGIFARRVAPVQAHYLGFFASTGLTEMDYWIGDAILTPEAAQGQFSETLWRLDRPWVSYDGKAEAPPTCWLPATDGTVRLGGFNRLVKLTSSCLALWARILAALPEANLLIKTKELADPALRQSLLASFASLGIGPERIELQDHRATPDWASHMAYYDRLDIALDPIGGVGGGTTTCDALWMGVPVIGLEGRSMATRMTTAMLHAIGRPEWLASDENDYIAKVVTLARDVALRRTLRPLQRARMAASPLCDGKDLARALEQAYFAMAAKRGVIEREQ